MVVADGFAWEGQTYDSLSTTSVWVAFGLVLGRRERPDDERCQTKALCPLRHLYKGVDRCRA